MLLARTTDAFLLLLFLQGIEGVKGATDPCVYIVSDHGDVTSDPGNKNDQDCLPCCVTGNCRFGSLEDALTNISNNVVIDIAETSVAMIKSITIENVNSILIKGQTNARVLCNNAGNLHFVSCTNVTIKGIVWQGCGGLQFHSSSDITIQDCCFHNSTRQAVVMSEMSEDIYIKNCLFTQSNDNTSYGSAIRYSSRTVSNPPSVLNINNCSFISNGPTVGSVVYIRSRTRCSLLLQDSVFSNNQGVPIYLSNVHVNVLGTVLLRQNTAKFGGGIFSTNSIIEFDNCSVQFYNNSATSGGAVFLEGSDMIFGINSSVMFENNHAYLTGGGIFSRSRSLLTFVSNSMVTFSNNTAGISYQQGGGAIYATGHSHMLFTDNSLVRFSSNSAGGNGGAIYAYDYSDIKFDGKSFVKFSNSVTDRGGAIEIVIHSHLLFKGNCMVDFKNNRATFGGAIRSSHSSDIFINENSVVTFRKNIGSAFGGTILLDGGKSDLFVNGDSTVTFDSNTGRDGGAIYISQYSDISFGGNAVINFTSNSGENGGVFFTRWDKPFISCHENSTLIFIDNHATYGGGVYILKSATILFGGNSIATFARNTASRGGAIYAHDSLQMRFNENTKVTFVNNTATYQGGAVYISNSDIMFDTPVIFQDNSALNGPAVYCGGHSYLSFEESLYKALAEKDGGDLHVGSNCSVLVEMYTCEYTSVIKMITVN
ncbi:probable outer membrane protein pmp6 [Dysidea avara]|uniref:probable outer membrane protein pmp6 n=1 Tax=Dysidea avara TaxID=196820 RepID=UPI0033236256